MSEWICRSCGGGFPHPIMSSGRWSCPWCGEQLAKWANDYGTKEIAKLVPSDLNGGER